MTTPTPVKPSAKKIHDTVLKNVNEHYDNQLTFGDRFADKLTEFGGSWTFIIAFFCVLMSWMFINAFLLISPFDPFPFILLNLLLSMLATFQAPIIMMSQNRQAERDRIQADLDFRVNLRAESEINEIQDKLDEIEELIKSMKK